MSSHACQVRTHRWGHWSIESCENRFLNRVRRAANHSTPMVLTPRHMSCALRQQTKTHPGALGTREFRPRSSVRLQDNVETPKSVPLHTSSNTCGEQCLNAWRMGLGRSSNRSVWQRPKHWGFKCLRNGRRPGTADRQQYEKPVGKESAGRMETERKVERVMVYDCASNRRRWHRDGVRDQRDRYPRRSPRATWDLALSKAVVLLLRPTTRSTIHSLRIRH